MTASHPPSVEQLRVRDEILQVMFWMASQGLGEQFTPEDINRFVACSEPDLSCQLGELGVQGLVHACNDRGWRLTERGETEARHRFADELADLVGTLGHSHGEACGADCTDPHEP